MNPELPFFVDDRSILLVNPVGNIRRLYTPFLVQVTESALGLQPYTWLYVEAVRPHPKQRLLYQVIGKWYPYYYFRLSSVF
jgi:hypothetical protein